MTMERIRFLYRAWRYRARVEPAEIAYVLAELRPGQTAVDIGAHKGAFTYWMHRAVGANGQVIAFEPQPELSAYLRRISRALGNVTVEASGVSSREGVLELTRPADAPSPGATLVPGHSEHGTTIQVPVCSIDAYLKANSAEPIALIKCDVEGHELEVFRGARETLLRDRPTLMFECEARHHRDGRIDQVFAYLEQLGFEGRCFHAGRTEMLDFAQRTANQIPGTKEYINNFCFRPAA